jgi:outer membrane protein OmpA-like peptidoglycan-associated protein
MNLVFSLVMAVLPAAGAEEPSDYVIRVQAEAPAAFDFRSLRGKAAFELRPTMLCPEAEGSVKARAGDGVTRLAARFERLRPAHEFGPGHLTYVLWAVTPAGTAENLGEVRADKGAAQLDAETALPAFGLTLTAEPDFAVRTPGNAVVMQAWLEPGSRGKIDAAQAPRPAASRGEFVFAPGKTHSEGTYADDAVPLDLRQAYLARHRAVWEGAGFYAPDPLYRAETALRAALNDVRAGRPERAALEAKAAARTAEQARSIAVDAKLEARAAAQRKELLALNFRSESARGLEEWSQAVRRDELRDALAQQAAPLPLSSVMVYFEPASSTLSPEARETLGKMANMAAARPNLHLSVRGHADAGEEQGYNMSVSNWRAQSVREYLIVLGVPPGAVTYMGYGSLAPQESNATIEGRRHNRRVEVIATDSGEATP